jgi:ABC-2 type transport system ATP-binding protein
MRKLGKRQLTLTLQEPMAALPAGLSGWTLALKAGGNQLECTFDAHADQAAIPSLLRKLAELGIAFKDLSTHQSSLEEIFVNLVHQGSEAAQ